VLLVAATSVDGRTAVRGGKVFPHKLAAISCAREPDSRTMPTPPCPGALATATIVVVDELIRNPVSANPIETG